METAATTHDGGRARLTRQEREARNREIVAARRRGVSAARIAEQHGMTRQAVSKIVREWDDVPSVPRPGVRVDTGEEVARTLRAFEQLIEDLGELVGSDKTAAHVKLGAASRIVDLHARRLQLMASAGYIAANLAAPLVEQEMVRLVRTVVEVLRAHKVPEVVVQELMTKARTNVRTPAVALEAVPA